MPAAGAPADWVPGSDRPTTIPPGQIWDETQARLVPDPKTGADPAWMTDPAFAHLDPRLAAVYKKNNRTPSLTAGTGFTDANYWNDRIKSDPSYDYLTRLDKDLAGTGTDRSTGTVWGEAGAPVGVDQNASNTANYSNAGANIAGLAQPGSLDVTSQGTGPGSYAWRQAQIYALQQRLANGQAR